tara:strand:+ start:118 stop:489 length:372 start_codon:yes stop_codon:yes gene_type:complete
MTVSDYMDLAIRAGGISLATYAVIGQVAKPLIRMIAKYRDDDGKLSRAQEEFLRWLTRSLCVAIGGIMGYMPLWPGWFEPSWGPILGCIAGSMSPGIYLAVSKALPKKLQKIISGASVSGSSK